jgi:LPS export ABC transporter protein LptC
LVDAELEMSLETATNVELIYTDSALLKAKINTPLMERFKNKENPYMEMKKGLTAKFFNKAQNEESNIRADYGISYENTKIVTLKKNVVLVNVAGERLESEELHWDQNKTKIFSDKFVTITRKNEIIYGDGFESNESFTRYKILKPTGRVNIKSEN